MIPASLLALRAAAGAYAAVCDVKPFRPSGRLRLGRRAHYAWRRTHDRSTR
jgi:hypothetical protein